MAEDAAADELVCEIGLDEIFAFVLYGPAASERAGVDGIRRRFEIGKSRIMRKPLERYDPIWHFGRHSFEIIQQCSQFFAICFDGE